MNGVAVLVLLGLVVAGIHWLGYDTGVPQWLMCRVAQPATMLVGPGLLQLSLVVGVVLAIVPFTRSAGISLLVLTLVELMLVDAVAGLTVATCTSASP